MLIRSAVYATILVAMAVVSVVSDELYLWFVGIMAVILPAFNFATWLLLSWASRQAPEIKSLRARANDAFTLFIASSAAGIAGAFALGRVTGLFRIDGRPVLILLGYMIVMMSVPAIDWLSTWRDVWSRMLDRRD